MATLADLMDVYAPPTPGGFTLAEIELANEQAKAAAAIGTERLLRNYNQFDLPDLLSAQAAKGAFRSSATENKQAKLSTGVGDQLTDIQTGLANTQAQLAANSLLAQTGIQLGGLL